MSCGYYDSGNRVHAGTCEEDRANAGHYSCRADDDTSLVETQVACEWKVKRLQEWQSNNQEVPTSGPSFQYLMPGVVKQVGGDVKGPVIIYQPEPHYTPEGRKAKVQGIVTVAMVVDEHGVPQNVHVSRGMGIGSDGKPDPKFKKAWRKVADGMNQSAVDAVTKYRFKPASENGKPVAVNLNVEVNFAIF
jgi:hypothetical protein